MQVQLVMPWWAVLLPVGIGGVLLYSLVAGFTYRKMEKKIAGYSSWYDEFKPVFAGASAFFWPVTAVGVGTYYTAYYAMLYPATVLSFPARKMYGHLVHQEEEARRKQPLTDSKKV